jgi:D-beta-D-heptose 7-phosphate kinase/D-beta-D-heptose 1-phosphate adenosyltransferase
VKGADYKIDEVVGRDVVESAGGDVLLVSLVPGHSTSGLVRRLAESAAPESALPKSRSTKPVES